jgi:putative transposase
VRREEEARFSRANHRGPAAGGGRHAPGDVCRQVGISERTFYRWKKVYGRMLPSEAREVKQLRGENAKLKRLVADLSLDKVMLQDVVQIESLKPVAQREAMRDVMGRYGVSARRACRLLRTTLSSVYYGGRKDPLTALRQRMRELAQTPVRFAYRRLRVLILRVGWSVGKSAFGAGAPSCRDGVQ